MKCYFCGTPEKIIPQKRMLWNGKQQCQCVHCFKCMEIGLKTAAEKRIKLISRLEDGDKMKLAEYKTAGDSVSLTNIDGQKFTIIGVEDSDYTEGDVITPGLKITTKEEFDVEGNKISKFHTTRKVIVETLKNPEIRQKLKDGETLGPLICTKVQGKKYFNMEDA